MISPWQKSAGDFVLGLRGMHVGDDDKLDVQAMIVTDFVSGGDLESQLGIAKTTTHPLGASISRPPLTVCCAHLSDSGAGAGGFNTHVARIAMEAAAALAHLHDRGVLHRDIASRNVLLNEHWHVRIADFGSAALLADAERQNASADAKAQRAKRIAIAVKTRIGDSTATWGQKLIGSRTGVEGRGSRSTLGTNTYRRSAIDLELLDMEASSGDVKLDLSFAVEKAFPIKVCAHLAAPAPSWPFVLSFSTCHRKR